MKERKRERKTSNIIWKCVPGVFQSKCRLPPPEEIAELAKVPELAEMIRYGRLPAAIYEASDKFPDLSLSPSSPTSPTAVDNRTEDEKRKDRADRGVVHEIYKYFLKHRNCEKSCTVMPKELLSLPMSSLKAGDLTQLRTALASVSKTFTHVR